MHGFAQKMGFHLIYKQGYKGTALTVALLCFALMFDICSHNRIPQCALCQFLAAPSPLLILLIASSANLTIRPSNIAGSRPTALLGAHLAALAWQVGLRGRCTVNGLATS